MIETDVLTRGCKDVLYPRLSFGKAAPAGRIPIGQRRGKFCDVTHLRGSFASVTFRKDGARILVPAARLTAVPARHDGDF